MIVLQLSFNICFIELHFNEKRFNGLFIYLALYFQAHEWSIKKGGGDDLIDTLLL